MTRFNLRICLIFFAVIISIHSSCPKENEGPEGPTSHPLDPLTDPIPFNELGHGKLVFKRIGPLDSNYEGVYVIDIDQQENWGIGGGVFMDPAVSPHGQQIAFTRLAETSTGYDVHIMDIDGSNIRNVTAMQFPDRQPSWTPDSSEILYWVDATVGHCLYRLTLYWKTSLIKIFSPGTSPDQGELGSIRRGPFSVSPDLRLVFIGNLTYVGQAIITMDIDGSNIQVVKSPPPEDAEYHSPVWSPDGQKIAFLFNYKDSSYAFKFLELFIMDADGSNLRSLVKFTTNATGSWSGYNDLSACWSPDGSKIAFNKKEEGNLISHIYIINPDGSGLTQVTFAEGVTDRSLTWSN